MYKDFLDYGWEAEEYCHRIYSGREKKDDRQLLLPHGNLYINLNASGLKNTM